MQKSKDREAFPRQVNHSRECGEIDKIVMDKMEYLDNMDVVRKETIDNGE